MIQQNTPEPEPKRDENPKDALSELRASVDESQDALPEVDVQVAAVKEWNKGREKVAQRTREERLRLLTEIAMDHGINSAVLAA